MAKLADVTEPISLLEEHLKSIKEKILKVEEAMEQLIAASTSLYTNYLLFINAIVLLTISKDLATRENLFAIVELPHLSILQVFPYEEEHRLLH